MDDVSMTMTSIRRILRSFRIAVALAVGVGLGLSLNVATAQPAKGQTEGNGQAHSGKTNRLARETSPYLLLHARNPVDWHPWGPEAFAKAKAEDKPIFLSIGYSSCYWCHVMERECFMNEEIAKALNNHFVCVKVDREERPDIDQIYMTALQAMGRGGWPLSMFLTPDGRPFFGGTYFPPKDREGMTGFPRIMQLVITAWREKRKEIDASADSYARLIRQSVGNSANLALAPGLNGGSGKVEVGPGLAAEGRFYLSTEFDPAVGGFGYDTENAKRPKFPEPSNLLYLLDQHRRDQSGRPRPKPAVSLLALETPQNRDPLEMTLTTLDHMARGGIRDQLAGGYHRYSVGRFWVVPHFEKMLYDNAQMASVLVEAFEVTGDPRWKREAQAVFDFLDQVMTTSEGGFMSALDAETEAVEGKTYVWTREEVRKILADGKEDDYRVFAQVYGLMREPNFEHDQYVLLEPRSREEQAQTLGLDSEELENRLAPLRLKLLKARDRRPVPLKDDKVLASWNGLTIAAYADAARVFKEDRYRRTAERAADLALAKLRTSDGRLLRTYRSGQAKLPAYLEDYAFMAYGLLRLHQATGEARRLAQAKELVDRMIADFRDPAGGFFYTANDHEPLLARSKDPQDGVLPSGNSVAVRDLVALAKRTGEAKYAEEARKTLEVFAGWLKQHPGGAPMMLIGLEEYLELRSRTQGSMVNASGKPIYVDGQVELAADAKPVPGGRVEAKLKLRIRDGWHIYANPSGSAQIQATTIALKRGSQAKILKTDYPQGKSMVSTAAGVDPVSIYEAEAVVTLTLELPDDLKPGDLELIIETRYQACDHMACLMPTTLATPLKLTIAAK